MAKGLKIINDKDLNKLKETELEILGEIERICIKYELSFFFIGGTLLGAVRHKGFIPWDDDLDICMTRDDFNKLKDVAADEFGDKYFLDYIDTNRDYHIPFAKVRKNNTTFGEKDLEGLDVHKGIFVDIFICDFVDGNSKRSYYKASFIQILADTVLLKKGLKNSADCNHPLLSKVFCIFSSHAILKFVDYLSSHLNGNKNNYDHVICFNDLVRFEKIYFKVDDIFPLKKVEFEGRYFDGPNDSDKYLKAQFGDYMKLPPVEDRFNHSVEYLSFTEGKSMVNKK